MKTAKKYFNLILTALPFVLLCLCIFRNGSINTLDTFITDYAEPLLSISFISNFINWLNSNIFGTNLPNLIILIESMLVYYFFVQFVSIFFDFLTWFLETIRNYLNGFYRKDM